MLQIFGIWKLKNASERSKTMARYIGFVASQIQLSDLRIERKVSRDREGWRRLLDLQAAKDFWKFSFISHRRFPGWTEQLNFKELEFLNWFLIAEQRSPVVECGFGRFSNFVALEGPRCYLGLPAQFHPSYLFVAWTLWFVWNLLLDEEKSWLRLG